MNRLQEALKEVDIKEIERMTLIKQFREIGEVIEKITQGIDDSEDIVEDMNFQVSALLVKIQKTKDTIEDDKRKRISFKDTLDNVEHRMLELGGVL